MRDAEARRDIVGYASDTAVRAEDPAGALGFGAGLTKTRVDAPGSGIDTEDFRGDDIAYSDDVARMRDVSAGEFGNMDGRLDGAVDADERLGFREFDDSRGYDLSDFKPRGDLVPGAGRGEADGELDPLRLTVDFDNANPDSLADGEQIGGMLDEIPGEFGDMGETDGAADVNEHAVILDSRDAPFQDVANMQLVDHALFLLGALICNGFALGEDHAIAGAIDLERFDAERAAYVFGKPAGVDFAISGGGDLADRNKGFDPAEIGD